MKLGTLMELLAHDQKFAVYLSPESLVAVCWHSVQNQTAKDAIFASGGFKKDALKEILHVDPILHKQMKDQFADDTAQRKSTMDAEAAKAEEKAAKRKQQIIAAIDQASKQKGLNPLALIRCGWPHDECPEPATTIWLNSTPESEFMNCDNILDAFCSHHWRDFHPHNSPDRSPIHWADLEFMHPSIPTVCVAKSAVWTSWTRRPEKFGKLVRTAKDSTGSTIRRGSLVVYHRPLGNPRASSGTEQSFGKVTKIWKVGGIKVIQLRRIIGESAAMKLSPRASVKYASKVIVLRDVPRKFKKVMA
jgi:hypothetical protein